MRLRLLAAFFICTLLGVFAAEFSCDFSAGGWDPADWINVKSPRWPHKGLWQQEEDHIRNQVPADASEQEMLNKRAGETYSSMLWKEKLRGCKRINISCELSFDHRMAPLLVIAPDYGTDAESYPEYRQHWEVVLYDKGLNLCHHSYSDGKASWDKAAAILCDFPAKERIDLQVNINLAGKVPMLEVRAQGKNLSYAELQLPKDFYVGLTGCEGINRFYNFKVRYQ